MNATHTKGVFAGLLIVWILVAIAGYYVFHHPFDQQFVARAIPASVEIAVSFFLVALAGGLGLKFLPDFKVPAMARLAVRAAFGLGLLSIGYLIVGSVIGTASWVAWSLVVALAIWLRDEIVQWARDLTSVSNLWTDSDGFGRLIGLLSSAIFFLAMITALALPLKFDSLMYHLTLPKIYISTGRVAYVQDIMTWGYPQLTLLLSTWVLALGASTGALISWLMGLLCVVGLAGHMHVRVGSRGAWVGIAVLLCGYSLAASLGWGYVDWPTLLMGWATIFYLDRWWENGEERNALLAGAFAGLGFGAKYTAGILAILGAFVLILGNRRRWRALAWFLVVAFGFAVPWLLKNLIFTGNPFYPLMFPAGAMDELRLGYFQGFAVQGTWLDTVLLAPRATWLGIEGGRILGAPGYEGSIGPLLLALSPLAVFSFVVTKKNKQLRQIAAVFGLGGLFSWAIAGRLSGQLIRTHFYYSIFPALAILSAFGFLVLEKLRLPNLNLGRVAGILVCFVLALNVLTLSIETLDSRAPLFLIGRISGQEFLETNLGLHAIVSRYLKDKLPGDARVIMLWEPRAYYCLPGCEPDEVIDRWIHDLAVHGNAESVFAEWREQGYDYVLYYRLAAEFVHQDAEHFHPFDLQELERGLTRLTLVENFNDDYLLYALSQ